jgi:2-polyprenyl-3-methyl-5-hydroxy-6-metoxy-1,4-benzoquinol methylase
MKDDSERYADAIKEYYLRRKGSRKGKDRLEEFYAQLTPHELNLIPKNKKILDAGAGDGLFTKLMKEKGNDVICVELSDELIQLCEENGLKCVKANLNSELPFPDNYFDVVFCRAVIEHLFDPWQFFEESYRVLKRGGGA